MRRFGLICPFFAFMIKPGPKVQKSQMTLICLGYRPRGQMNKLLAHLLKLISNSNSCHHVRPIGD